MGNADGSLHITYNGEIYNFKTLRVGLERAGYAFRTKSDTETILHQFAEHGTGGIAALNGMFAFAIWDARNKCLVLARDRAGIKPLYYATLPGGGLAFASELSAILAHGAVERKASVPGLRSYFFSDYIHPPLTIFESVKKLLPGHFLIWRDGKLFEPEPFWRVPLAARAPLASDGDLAKEFWCRLELAVERQLIADVPVGIFLSGGLDSSAIATIASQRAGRRMKAFSIGFQDKSFDESSYARLVAQRLDVELVEDTLHESNLLDVIDIALAKLDEPLADPSYLPTFLLSKLASRHVKVVVGGDGGDELWAGYPTYRAHRYASLYASIPKAIRKNILEAAIRFLPVRDGYQSMEWKLRRFTERWDDDPMTRHLRWMSSVDAPDLASAILGADKEPATYAARSALSQDVLNQILALDFTTYMSGSVLTKVDRASMAHGLEARPPLLDNDMIDWAFSLPSHLKLRRGVGKFLFKEAARPHLPPEIIDRPKKGFGIPLAAWLRGPLASSMATVIDRSPAWDLNALNRETFVRWHREHMERSSDRSKPLWALYVLDRWLKDGGGASAH